MKGVSGMTGCNHYALDFQNDYTQKTSMIEFLKPKGGDLREDFALVRDRVVHYHVERGDAVAGDHQEAVIAGVVDVTHLAAVGEFQVGEPRGMEG